MNLLSGLRAAPGGRGHCCEVTEAWRTAGTGPGPGEAAGPAVGGWAQPLRSGEGRVLPQDSSQASVSISHLIRQSALLSREGVCTGLHCPGIGGSLHFYATTQTLLLVMIMREFFIKHLLGVGCSRPNDRTLMMTLRPASSHLQFTKKETKAQRSWVTSL